MVRIDGKPYRIMGPSPADVPAMKQNRLLVLPTHTIYMFEAGGVEVWFTFMSPTLAA